MQISINGRTKNIEQHLSIIDLLQQLNINPGLVVVELNGKALSPDIYSSTHLNQDDIVELIQFVGGG